MSSQEPPKKKSKQVENKQGTLLSWVKPCTSDTEPGVVQETIRISEQPGNNCLSIFRERYPKQVLYFVKVNTNWKLETRAKGIVDKCSDLTYQEVCFNRGTEAGGAGLMWVTRSAPPVILCLPRAWEGNESNRKYWEKMQKKNCNWWTPHLISQNNLSPLDRSNKINLNEVE